MLKDILLKTRDEDQHLSNRYHKIRDPVEDESNDSILQNNSQAIEDNVEDTSLTRHIIQVYEDQLANQRELCDVPVHHY